MAVDLLSLLMQAGTGDTVGQRKCGGQNTIWLRAHFGLRRRIDADLEGQRQGEMGAHAAEGEFVAQL